MAMARQQYARDRPSGGTGICARPRVSMQEPITHPFDSLVKSARRAGFDLGEEKFDWGMEEELSIQQSIMVHFHPKKIIRSSSVVDPSSIPSQKGLSLGPMHKHTLMAFHKVQSGPMWIAELK